MTTRRRPARVPVKAHTRARTGQARAAGSMSVSPPEWFVMHPWLREAGVYVNAETASQVAAVYGCARLIVDCLVPAPIVASEIQAGGKREILHDDPVAWTLNYGAPVREAPDAPTAQAIEEALYWSALLDDGNGYAEIQRDGSGKFFALWPIENSRVTPKRDEAGFYYEVRQYSGGVARLHPMDMFHVRGPSLKGYVGDSIIYRAAKAIGIAHASQVFHAAYYANGTVISGLLSSDKNVTKEQADRAKAQWVENFGGPSSAHGVAVTGQGLKFQPISHNAQEAAVVESRKFQVHEVARFFGVPTALIGENEAWTALSELYRAFYTTLLVWSERFDAEATRKLYPHRQPWREVSHDLTYLTLGSFKDQIESLTKATGRPFWTVNEARAIQGKNSIAGGDKLADPPKPAAAPRPERDDPEPREEPEREPERGAVAVLERHARRVAARSADLAKKGNSAVEIAEHVGHLRAQARAEIRAVMPGTDGKAIAAAIEAVEHGVPPDKAALQIGEVVA